MEPYSRISDRDWEMEVSMVGEILERNVKRTILWGTNLLHSKRKCLVVSGPCKQEQVGTGQLTKWCLLR